MSTTAQPDPAAPTAARRRYWTRRVDGSGNWRTDHASGTAMRSPGEDLAAMRAGLGREAGAVPELWRFYTSPIDGRVTPELEAEHAALSLYGLHQQSQSRPMHRPGISMGAALRTLHHSQRFSEEAVDRRVAATVHTTSVSALVYRLRGLITQLRAVEQPVDYDQLLLDIQRWKSPGSRQQVRRGWGLAYHAWGARPGNGASPKDS
ncbi:type I-E CRISPR-associated protein Cse2/CasB [Streptomyces sp. NPDC051018]|uniref:type I-E CRISPR-associated protein Cse2/CasB n=1 Tax=Streptomyces sp. NPDC051018 TaxID=3365639 RepID=UPI0037A0C85F